MQVTGESIGVASNLPIDGEKWFKNKMIIGGDVNQFLKPEHRDPNRAKGIPRDWIVDEWMEALLMLKRFITCEGRYSTIFLFHLRFLLHLAGIKRMNLPYYFLRDLNKMAMKVQANPKTPPHGIYHQGLIKVLVKAELGKLQKTWDQFLIQSGFEKEVHPPVAQSHDNVVKSESETPPGTSRSANAKKGKRVAFLKTPDEPIKATSSIQQADAGFSRILGQGKHPFPFAQKNYSKRAKRLVEPRVFMEDQQPKTTMEFEDLVQPEEPIPEVTPHASSSSEDNVAKYRILIKKRSTRPRNKFRMKSKVMYKPVITEKVIIIDEEPTKPMEKPSTSKKFPVIKPERNKSKNGSLTMNKKTPTDTNRVPARKQGKKNVKGSNPKIGSEGDKPTRMQTTSQSKQTIRNGLDLLAEAASSVFHGDLPV